MKPVAIIGAGISGLTAGFYLERRGIPVVIFEASHRVGGMIRTSSAQGFLVEQGPNTIMTNSAAVPALLRDLGLESRRLLPSATASTRYIVRNSRLVRVPGSFTGAIRTNLLSPRAKLRVLGEPFIGRTSVCDESLAAFVRRRLGREFLDYLIDPFVAGVYAGDPEQLSIAHALPKMATLEQRWGSLVRGAVLGAKERRIRNAPIAGEPRMFSLDQGLQVVTDTLGGRLNRSLRLCSPVNGIEPAGAGWRVRTEAGNDVFGSVLFCSPAHHLARMDAPSAISAELQQFQQVYYPPIARLAFGFGRSQVQHPLDGFGALVPTQERMSILGVLFSSSMFPDRAPADQVLLTVFAGGARQPGLLHDAQSTLEQRALDDLRLLLGISGEPTYRDVVTLPASIPQYNVGYGAVKDLIRRLEANAPGLHFAGNFCHGISVSDCITGGVAVVEKVAAAVRGAPQPVVEEVANA